MSLKPIKTAILSYGMSGEVFHAPLIHAHLGFELSLVLQRSKKSAEAHYPNCRVVKTFEEVLSDPSIELVVVNTPNHLHLEQAAKSLQAGKHVIVEKPFTVTVQEADELIALARKQNKMLTVFQSRRVDGDFLTLKKVVDSKWVCKINIPPTL